MLRLCSSLIEENDLNSLRVLPKLASVSIVSNIPVDFNNTVSNKPETSFRVSTSLSKGVLGISEVKNVLVAFPNSLKELDKSLRLD